MTDRRSTSKFHILIYLLSSIYRLLDFHRLSSLSIKPHFSGPPSFRFLSSDSAFLNYHNWCSLRLLLPLRLLIFCTSCSSHILKLFVCLEFPGTFLFNHYSLDEAREMLQRENWVRVLLC